MKILVVVEASGKIDMLQKKLKSINIHAEVLATVGHVAENPRSLNPIAFDSGLRETHYEFRQDRMALLEKIQKAALSADRIYLAMDDDQEGDVIAYDVAWVLEDHADKLYRVRLRALSDAELSAAFTGDLSKDFKSSAHNGICRRIVDRAIGATFSKVNDSDPIPVGRVQSSLLATIAEELPEMGHFVIPVRAKDGTLLHADVPVYKQSELQELQAINKVMATGDLTKFKVSDLRDVEVPASVPWGYEDVIEQASIRLRMGIEQASDALQEAYERGRISYPRVRRNGFTQDAVEVAAALANQNRTQFSGAYVPRRASGASGVTPHESLRPMDEDMLLGRALAILDAPEAIAVLVARNIIECGQKEKRRVLQIEIDGWAFDFTSPIQQPMRSWKKPEVKAGYQPYERDCALLRYMSRHELGRPSTVVNHVSKFLQRNLINSDGSNFGLNERGQRWLDHAKAAGFAKTTSKEMEEAFSKPLADPNAAAREILDRFGMLSPVQAQINKQNEQQKAKAFEI